MLDHERPLAAAYVLERTANRFVLFQRETAALRRKSQEELLEGDMEGVRITILMLPKRPMIPAILPPLLVMSGLLWLRAITCIAWLFIGMGRIAQG